MYPAVYERLSEWCFDADGLGVKPSPDLPADHPQALRAAVVQLGSLRLQAAGVTTVVLRSWQWQEWTTDAAQWLAESLPTLPQFIFSLGCERFDDDLMRLVLRVGPGLPIVFCSGWAVLKASHTTSVWPWAVLFLGVCSAADLVNLPRADDAGEPRLLSIENSFIKNDILQVRMVLRYH